MGWAGPHRTGPAAFCSCGWASAPPAPRAGLDRVLLPDCRLEEALHRHTDEDHHAQVCLKEGAPPPRIGCCPSLPLGPAWSPAGAPRAAHTQASEPSPGPASLPGMLTPSAPSGPHRGAASSRKPPRCISSGCHSKLVRTWLKTTEIHSLALLRADRAAAEGSRGESRGAPSFGGLQVYRRPYLHRSGLCVCLHTTSFPRVWVQFSIVFF